MQVDVATNFDVVATCIRAERFIGLGFLNSVWPINRMDILSSTWQTLAYIVNLTNPHSRL